MGWSSHNVTRCTMYMYVYIVSCLFLTEGEGEIERERDSQIDRMRDGEDKGEKT